MSLKDRMRAKAEEEKQDDLRSVEAQLTPPPTTFKLADKLKAKAQEEKEICLDVTGEATGIDAIHKAKEYVNQLLEAEGFAPRNLEIALRETLKVLKQYPETILELQPEDISDIVSGYMALADAELKSIFDKQAKKSKSTPASRKLKEMEAAAKEGATQDISTLDLDGLL